MIILNAEEHNDICGGCSYSGTANFDGRTVKKVVIDEVYIDLY